MNPRSNSTSFNQCIVTKNRNLTMSLSQPKNQTGFFFVGEVLYFFLVRRNADEICSFWVKISSQKTHPFAHIFFALFAPLLLGQSNTYLGEIEECAGHTHTCIQTNRHTHTHIITAPHVDVVLALFQPEERERVQSTFTSLFQLDCVAVAAVDE